MYITSAVQPDITQSDNSKLKKEDLGSNVHFAGFVWICVA